MVVKYFEEHLHKEHNLGTPNHCPHCDKSIVSLKAFLYHVKNHTDQGLRCPICGASQKNKVTKINLIWHIRGGWVILDQD